MIQIVNVKNGPKCKYLYIGRENKHYELPQSKWANPFVIGKDGNRELVIDKYRLWINSQPELLNSLNEIKGQNFLGCWCDWPKENCHGNVLIDLAKSKYIKNWFSNMLLFDKPLIYQGLEFKAVENFYQAMKLPKDRLDLRAEIANLSPFESKTAIRNEEKYKWDQNWTQYKSLEVMEYALRYKFSKVTKWYRKLMITKELNLELVEFNNWNDLFWGKDIKTLNGENHLGKILMRIRDE